jgi:hypothetical protein
MDLKKKEKKNKTYLPKPPPAHLIPFLLFFFPPRPRLVRPARPPTSGPTAHQRPPPLLSPSLTRCQWGPHVGVTPNLAPPALFPLAAPAAGLPHPGAAFPRLPRLPHQKLPFKSI